MKQWGIIGGFILFTASVVDVVVEGYVILESFSGEALQGECNVLLKKTFK